LMVDPANSGPIRLQRPRLSRSAGDERQWVKWVRWVKWGRPTRPRGRARTGRILGRSYSCTEKGSKEKPT
jgi:hypothetical protein